MSSSFGAASFFSSSSCRRTEAPVIATTTHPQRPLAYVGLATGEVSWFGKCPIYDDDLVTRWYIRHTQGQNPSLSRELWPHLTCCIMTLVGGSWFPKMDQARAFVL